MRKAEYEVLADITIKDVLLWSFIQEVHKCDAALDGERGTSPSAARIGILRMSGSPPPFLAPSCSAFQQHNPCKYDKHNPHKHDNASREE